METTETEATFCWQEKNGSAFNEMKKEREERKEKGKA
jgi:hypothetical protein